MSGQFEATLAGFEVMPFGAGGGQSEAQLEQERGRRGGGGRGARGGARPPARPPARGRSLPPPRWPAYPVAGWPWARWDAPTYAPDGDEPYQPPAYEPFDDGPEGEVKPEELQVLKRLPTELGNYLKGLPDARRPRYRFLGGLLAAANSPRTAGMGGLYLIVFRSGGRLKAYNGISDDLRQRLQAHVACASRLGLERYLGKHEVYFARPPGNTKARTIEISINRQFLKPGFNVLTNQQLEFEAELLGEGWL